MKVSIITATYNAEKTIESAINSVMNQTYSNIEYIIIDGGSSDKTLQIIDQYKSNISKIISESDQGIYDALNKGIKHATGDVVGFLHADDLFENNNTIALIANEFRSNQFDAVYGDLEYVNHQNPDKIIRYWRSKSYKSTLLREGWMPPHPTLFIKKEVYHEIGLFDTSYKISADYEFILRFFSNSKFRSKHLPLVITKMRVGGTSNKSIGNIILKSKEDLRALKRNKVGGVITLFWKNISKLPQFINR